MTETLAHKKHHESSAPPEALSFPLILEDIKKLVKNYKTTLPPGSDDATSAWVPLSEILALTGDNPTANGIRIYYGRHGADDKLYPHKHTVILVPTRDDTTPDNPAPKTSNDLLDPEAVIKLKSAVVYKGMGDDRIPLCPPNCSPTSL